MIADSRCLWESPSHTYRIKSIENSQQAFLLTHHKTSNKYEEHIFPKNELTFCANRTASFSVEYFALVGRGREKHQRLMFKKMVC